MPYTRRVGCCLSFQPFHASLPHLLLVLLLPHASFSLSLANSVISPSPTTFLTQANGVNTTLPSLDDDDWVEILSLPHDLVQDWLLNDTNCSSDVSPHDLSPKKDGVDFREVRNEITEHILGKRNALSDPEHLRLRAQAAWEDQGGRNLLLKGPLILRPQVTDVAEPEVQEATKVSPELSLEDVSEKENGSNTHESIEEKSEEKGILVKEDGSDILVDGDASDEGGGDTVISKGDEVDEYVNKNGNDTEDGEDIGESTATREGLVEETRNITKDKLILEGGEENKEEEEMEKGDKLIKEKGELTEVMVEEGSRLRLVCNVTGIKHIWVEWRRASNLTFPGGAAVVGGRSVLFDFVGREDAGTYICTARNTRGSTYSTALTIHVHYAPVVGVWARTVGQEGVELGCLGEGHPRPTLAWYKNNTKLSSACGGNTEVKSTNLSPWFVLSVVKLTNTTTEDFAFYHCRAANSVGVSRSFLMVHNGSGEMNVEYLDHEDPIVYSTPVENPRLASFLLGMVPPLYIALYIIAYLGCYKTPSTGGHGRFGANVDMDGE